MPLRVAVLIKQVPKFETMELGADGRLRRDGLPLEMNPYCRRAVSKGAELAHLDGGTATVFTLGPPSAEDALREAIAWGADDGVLISDPAFAGSDTLATAKALAAALRQEDPFDLILLGRNSVDADTGQVGPELAELLHLPFMGGVRVMELDSDHRKVAARCEYDDGWVQAEVPLPAVLSCAERLCEPAKVDFAGRGAVAPDRIRRVSAAQLGAGPWGQAASPTSVGEVRLLEVERQRKVLGGGVGDQVREAIALLVDRGALDLTARGPSPAERVPSGPGKMDGPAVAVVIEPDRPRVARELLGAAARLAEHLGGRVVAIASERPGDDFHAAPWGADLWIELRGALVEEDVARALCQWCAEANPWAVLAPGTMWGREVLSRAAARLDAGLTGDAVDLTVDNGRLVGWKPAFGGRLVAAITASSAVQMATVRPGMLALLAPRRAGDAVPTQVIAVTPANRVVHLDAARDDELDALAAADVVVGVGTGVDPLSYPDLDPLLRVLDAELAATRKVTDKGWLPRARQVGITGRSIGPRLYVALGIAGKFNHVVGFRGAGAVLAVNTDADALVFESADVGIVGDWREVVPLLVSELKARRAAPPG